MWLGVNSCDDSYIREVTCEGEWKACVDRRPTVRQSVSVFISKESYQQQY